MGNELQARATLEGEWVPIANSGTVTTIAVAPDGAIVGVGPDRELLTRTTLESEWVPVSGSLPVYGVAIGAVNP